MATARMRISPDDWLLLAEELLKRKIVRAILLKDMIKHNGRYLTNGIFGVGKGKFIKCPKTQKELEKKEQGTQDTGAKGRGCSEKMM